MEKILLALGVALGWSLAAQAESRPPMLGTNEMAHVIQALDVLNLTTNDLGFAKDHGEPVLALQAARRLLAAPLELPPMADKVLDDILSGKEETLWNLASRLLETSIADVPAQQPPATITWPDDLDPALVRALESFLAEAATASALVQEAFKKLTAEEKRYLATAELYGAFQVEKRPDSRAALLAAGSTEDDLARVEAEEDELDPEPSALHYVGCLRRVSIGHVLASGRTLQQAATTLARTAETITNWPATPQHIPTPWGNVVIGTPKPDRHSGTALLILDPDGDDIYSEGAGSANGLLPGTPLAVIVDLRGDDTYTGTGLLGPGCALFGAAVVLDLSGNDVYRAAFAGPSSACYGAAWLEDRGGDDHYCAHSRGQAAAVVGAAIHVDAEGNDLYEIGWQGQAYAGVMGAALLVDRRGNDRYLAGGFVHDYERLDARYLSLAQGFAIGLRPFVGGGAAVLADLDGNDVYVADVYGQGVSYWYSLAMLLDLGGDDHYTVYQYGQGSGIHLSAGLLYDADGDDVYTGQVLVQGNAHDYAVGILLDRAGNDIYTARGVAQGAAINNSVALLIDAAGDDAYFAIDSGSAQGASNDGGPREYGGVALLLDLLGKDRYSAGGRDGCRFVRPHVGIVYDVVDQEAKP